VRLISTAFLTLDGVMEGPGGDEHRDGRNRWALRLQDQENQDWNLQQVLDASAILLGRKTYQIWAAFWPSAPAGVLKDRLDALPKYVVSRTLHRVDWANTTILSGDPAAEVEALKARSEGDVLMYGSADLTNALLARDLIDEYRLLIFPVLLGSGKHLFADRIATHYLRLVSTRTFQSGIVLLTYRREVEEPTSPFVEEYTWTDEQVRSFQAAQNVDRILATVLFTDIVDSTARAASMGDKAWRDSSIATTRSRTARWRAGWARTSRAPATGSWRSSRPRPVRSNARSASGRRRPISISGSGPACTPARSSAETRASVASPSTSRRASPPRLVPARSSSPAPSRTSRSGWASTTDHSASSSSRVSRATGSSWRRRSRGRARVARQPSGGISLTEPTTHTLDVDGATLAYDIRPNESSTKPSLVLIGSPMGADGFDTLSSYFTDRTVVTYDPRGSERSHRTDGQIENTTEEHGDDVHRVIEAVGGAPVDLFASSGGAVNALSLVARYPEDVRVLVAHEPPDFAVLPDREQVLAATDDMYATYQRQGFGAAMAKFIALTSHKGQIPAGFAAGPAPDPAMFGLPTKDNGQRDDPLFARNPKTVRFEPAYDALRRAPTRIVMAVGEASADQMTDRATRVIAERLGSDLAVFPGGHGGFNRSEWDPTADPEAFAAKLRELLDSPA
jgi:dihydrofolate reductase/pimeloyl-ACP methyl ester carboxylesterase